MSGRAKASGKTAEILKRGLEVVASRRSDLEGMYPVAFRRGKGATLWDYDGNSYLDFTAATGAVILGYANDRVDEAAARAASRGGTLPMQITDLQVELAEMLTGLLRWPERALFFRTGSDACSAAVRVCRTYTGKRFVLSSGYHGWHDWQLNMYPAFPFHDPYTENFGYNLNRLEERLRDADDIACVIVTPEPNFFPAAYWRELRCITERRGVLLVFDEVMTGFRYGMAGFHQKVRVRPDLVALSKGLANGYALSAVLGRGDVMFARERTHLWGTFNGDMAAFAAALATTRICAEEDVPRYLAEIGDTFIAALRKLLADYGVIAAIKTRGPLFHVIFEDEPLWQDLVTRCVAKGLLLCRHDSQVMMAAHTEKDVAHALSLIKSALDECRKARPASFGLPKSARIGEAKLLRRTFYEFGGRMDYRAPSKSATQRVLRLNVSGRG